MAAAMMAMFAFPALPLPFEPTYEWQPVLEGQGVPAGLDVKMELHGSSETQHAEANGHHSRVARIPETWRLQIWLEDFFGRVDVHRDTSIGILEASLARQVEEHRMHTAAHDASMRRRMKRAGGARARGGGDAGARGNGDSSAASCTVELYHKSVRLRAGATAEAMALFELQHALEPTIWCTGVEA
jgi:hypothetical protein